MMREVHRTKGRFSGISRKDREDILQEILIEIWLSDKTFPSFKMALRFWRNAYAKSCCLFLRRLKKTQMLPLTDTLPEQEYDNHRVIRVNGMAFRDFTIRELLTEANRWKRMSKEIICCLHYDAYGLSKEKICEMQGLSRRNLNNYIIRGRKKLEEIIRYTYLIGKQYKNRRRS